MQKLVVLSGAGMSAESGIPTFRGIDGLWEGHRYSRALIYLIPLAIAPPSSTCTGSPTEPATHSLARKLSILS